MVKSIIPWACWVYGKLIKWAILFPLWELRHCIYTIPIHNIWKIEIAIYRHGLRVRKHWDDYMYWKERDDL